jgi:hypothetical protein
MSSLPYQTARLEPDVAAPPWWRFPIAWLALGLPAAAVVAATASAVIAIRHADPVVEQSRDAWHATRAGGRPDAVLPAEVARNQAATPRR